MNKPIEPPSNALWQQQWQRQNPQRFDEDFWKAYERLIEEAKAEQSEPVERTPVKSEDKVAQLLAKYWTKVPKFDCADSDIEQGEPSTAVVVVFGVLATTAIVLLLANFHWASISTMLAIGVIVIGYFPDKNSLEGKVDIQVRLEVRRLVYRLQYCYNIKEAIVYVPYNQIEALLQHKKGIKLVGRGGAESWQDLDKTNNYEIILPQEMKGYTALRLFLYEVAT
ncbi:hypothetical protein [uncultured Microscilla sp.]|uniref:hypothetical protein n=1 Tax=uncultured Microscilla sp. TaxID=432653 RepID=UPI0026169C71|nr:hypothetical protein [uncultured Microscilla sp.]